MRVQVGEATRNGWETPDMEFGDGAGGTEGRYVRANGIDIHYTTRGRGVPLILLHGSLDCTGAMWNERIPALARHFRVIVPDARAHGRTRNPKDELSLPLLADDVLAFSEALALEKPCVCGLSMGGMTALTLAMRRPDAMRALIVIGAATHCQFPKAALEKQRAIGIGGPGVVDTDLFERSCPERVQRLRAMHPQGGDHWKRLLRQVATMSRQRKLCDVKDYAKIAVPTLIVMGDRDHVFPVEEAVTMYRHMPDSELAVIPQGGHGLFGPRAKLLDEIVVEFLLRRTGAGRP